MKTFGALIRVSSLVFGVWLMVEAVASSSFWLGALSGFWLFISRDEFWA